MKKILFLVMSDANRFIGDYSQFAAVLGKDSPKMFIHARLLRASKKSRSSVECLAVGFFIKGRDKFAFCGERFVIHKRMYSLDITIFEIGEEVAWRAPVLPWLRREWDVGGDGDDCHDHIRRGCILEILGGGVE